MLIKFITIFRKRKAEYAFLPRMVLNGRKSLLSTVWLLTKRELKFSKIFEIFYTSLCYM